MAFHSMNYNSARYCLLQIPPSSLWLGEFPSLGVCSGQSSTNRPIVCFANCSQARVHRSVWLPDYYLSRGFHQNNHPRFAPVRHQLLLQSLQECLQLAVFIATETITAPEGTHGHIDRQFTRLRRPLRFVRLPRGRTHRQDWGWIFARIAQAVLEERRRSREDQRWHGQHGKESMLPSPWATYEQRGMGVHDRRGAMLTVRPCGKRLRCLGGITCPSLFLDHN